MCVTEKVCSRGSHERAQLNCTGLEEMIGESDEAVLK